MRFYFAPMEGVTGYVYRNAHKLFFDNIDKYFSPFIAATQSNNLKTREMRDILPENNLGMVLVPQILTNKADDFINTARRIGQLGYDEINLNLGCPSGTVVAKHKGAGFLARQKELDEFLDAIFSWAGIRISVKTRIGKDHPEEFYGLIDIFNKYPLEELIIHPRIQKDLYGNMPNMNVFRDALRLSSNPVCYNGDIFSAADYQLFTEDFSQVDRIMLGRGLLANPGLISTIMNGSRLEKSRLQDFHDNIYAEYRQMLSGERNVLYKMKELWEHMIVAFPDSARYAKKIRKSERLKDYEAAVTSLFEEKWPGC